MRRKSNRWLIAMILMIIVGLVPTAAAVAQEGTCILKAFEDVYLEAYDYDEDGTRTTIFWSGRINAGESVTLYAPHGRFSYDYTDEPDNDRPLSSTDVRLCTGDEVIGVP